MTNQTTPQLLREIADVWEKNPEDGFREFEFLCADGKWAPHYGWAMVFADAYKSPQEIRRRPRTIKVSGEVPEEIAEELRRAGRIGDSLTPAARALLDLIESGGD